MHFIFSLMSGRFYWLLVAALGLLLNGTALYYQHVLGDEPCQLCVHVRIWVAAFTVLGLLMAVLPRAAWLYVCGNALLLATAIGLWERSWFLYQLENGRGDGSCEFFLGFPDWFALDVWFPEIFEVRNLCGYTPDVLFGISMAEGLLMVAAGLGVAAVIAAVVNLRQATD